MTYESLIQRRGLESLMTSDAPFHIAPQEVEETLFDAMVSCFRHHYVNNPGYRAICTKRGVTPDDLCTMDDLSKIPLVASTFFRSASAGQYGASIDNIASMPIEMLPPALRFTTSGTTAKTPSVYPYDPASVDVVIFGSAMALKHMFELEPSDHVLFLTCEKSATGMTRGMKLALQRILKKPESQTAFAMEELTSPLDARAIRDSLLEFQQQGTVHLYGPPYAYNEVADKLIAEGLTMRLGSMALAMTSGGWKSHKEGQITEAELRRKIYLAFGIEPRNHRDIFGLTDIMTGFPQCEKGYFHVAPWVYLSIRDPEDVYLREPLQPGQDGQIAFACPLIASFPPFIATGDIGMIVTPGQERCGCGRYGTTFLYKGRVGLPAGCALVQESQQAGG